MIPINIELYVSESRILSRMQTKNISILKLKELGGIKVGNHKKLWIDYGSICNILHKDEIYLHTNKEYC